MKRLLIALVAAVAVSTGFARVTTQQGFESGEEYKFVAEGTGDESAPAAYDSAPTGAVYPFSNFGSQYLDIDTGDATLWCANEGSATYFDMYMQFNVSTTEPDIADGTKLAVYLDSASNLVVKAGDGSHSVTNLNPGTWARLTIAGGDAFTVYFNGENLGSFSSMTNSATITAVGFNGSGALDNFVARTTDPFIQSPAATVDVATNGGEGYSSYSAALQDVLVDGATKTITVGQNTMNGSEHPYEIASSGDLLALQNAINANLAMPSTVNFKQTANIDMTGVAGFYGIGWFTSSSAYASLPQGVTNKQDIAFKGVYDGNGKTISNVTIVRHNYAGVFNNVEGTVKDLTVSNITYSSGTCSEWGCAIVGNAQKGALLENLTSAGTWGDNDNHNVAGIVVRPIGNVTIRGCVNNAAISATAKRVGGIAAFIGSGSTGTVFDSCTNTAAIISTDGTRGVGGILGCAEGGTTDTATIIRNCVDFGSETAQAEGGHAGAIVGSNWNGSYTYTDDGGNIFKASTVDCGYAKNAVFGRAYAVAAGTIGGDDYLMTVKSSDLAKNNTYTLMTDIAASETPVIELDDAGDTIAFDLNDHTFAGTVTVKHDGVTATPVTSDGVTTYTAAITDQWAYRLGNPASDGAYEIDNLDELKAFKAGIETPLATTDKTFRLTANIDASGITWAGIGTRDNATTAFVGTLDGDGYAINNLTLKAAKYSGFFNELRGTVKNLTINVAGFETTSAAEHGYAAFAGNTAGARFENCVATGTIGTTEKPAMHTCGGFVVKVASATTFVACTNRINIVCSLQDNPKVGGIVGLAQGETLTNCWNEGNITITCKKCKDNGNGAGGLIGYAQTAACTIVGGGNAGTIQSTNTTADGGSHEVHVGSIIGMANAAMTVSGGTVAQDTIAAFGTGVANANGLKFATVDNGVATFVADNALALNGSYKVMGANVTATFAFAEAGTIAFDTALATPTYAITAANGLALSDATEGTVKTYTATETYTITFISGEGSTTNTATYLKGETVTAPTPATVNGKTFSGWDSEVVTPAAADATYTAEYAFDNYAIAYLNEDGSAFTQWADNYAAPTNYTIATTAVTLPTAEDVNLGTGVTFGGWTNETGTVTGWAAGQTGAVTVYAKLDPVTAPVIPANSDTTEIAGTGEEIATDVADAVAVGATTEAAAAIKTAVESDPTYDYQANFTKTAVYNNESGKWEVTAKIADAVEKAVNEDAVAELLEAAVDSETTAVSVAVPAGLYYRVTTYDAIGGTPVQTKTGLSAGTTEAVNKPTTAGKGFIKVEMGTKSYED